MRFDKTGWILLLFTGIIFWLLACNGRDHKPPQSPSWREINRNVLIKMLESNNPNVLAPSDSGGGQDTMAVKADYCMSAITLSDSGGGQDTMRVTNGFRVGAFALSDSGGGQDTMSVGGRLFKLDYRFSIEVAKDTKP